MSGVRSALRAGIVRALKARDRSALAAYRQAAATIDNAEAVPVSEVTSGALEDAPLGAGASEAPRRTLTESEMRSLVRDEVADLREAAAAARETRPDRAAEADQGAAALQDLLAGLE